MQERKLKKQLQKSIALASVATFLLMPVNVAYGANNITAGASGVGSLTQITGGQGSVTDVTSGFVQNGTGINHFQNFVVGAGGTANLRGQDAVRFVNMVNSMAQIDGVLNAFKVGGNLPANVMFISPEGMAVGAGGVLNVGGLQVVTPTQADYNKLIEKAGTDITNITLKESDFANLKAGGTGYVSIDGKIYSTDDVVIQAGNGIYFQDGGIINTNAIVNGVSGVGDITLFTNTGNIEGSNSINLDANGNITLSAKNGGVANTFKAIGDGKKLTAFGEKSEVTTFNVKVAEGKKLNVEVADSVLDPVERNIKGRASVTNHTTNLTLGTVKGANVEITNAGSGTLATTEAIADVNKIYLNAENGVLDVANNVTAKGIIRLNGKVGVEAAGNLEVTDAGYISVYSKGGDINMADAKLKSGNITITAREDKNNRFGGNVSHGNITINERGAYETTMFLKENADFGTGEVAPDVFRADGVQIIADSDIANLAGTKIDSAGRVDLTAAGSIDSTVKAVDEISSVGGKTNLNTLGTARLGKISATNLTVTGENILVDQKVSATGAIDITATDKVTIRPRTDLDGNGPLQHYTYGSINGGNDVTVNAKNGILATEQNPEGAMISGNKINLVTDGDIKATGKDGNKITVSSNGFFNATGKNVNIHSVDAVANVGTIKATNDANISGAGKVVVNQLVEAGNNLAVNAVKDIEQVGQNVAFKSGSDMVLNSAEANVGQPTNYLNVEVADGLLDATAPKGGVYIAGNGDLNINNVTAGKDAVIKANSITAIEATTGKDLTLEAKDGVVVTAAKVGGELNATANGQGADVDIQTVGAVKVGTIKATNDVIIAQDGDLTINNIVEAGNNVEIVGDGAILQAKNKATKPAVKAGNDMTLVSNKKDVGAPDNYLTVDVENGLLEASAPKGGVYIEGVNDLNVAKAEAGKDVALKTPGTLTVVDAISGKDLNLDAANDIVVTKAQVGGVLNATAQTGSINLETPKNLTIGKVNAATDAVIIGDGFIHQTKNANKPAITTGKDLTLVSNNDNVGDPNNYLTVKVGGELDATAPKGGVYIEGLGDLNVDKVVAGKDVGLKAENNLHQVAQANPEDPRIISGGNMKLESANANVGDPNNYLQVTVGGQLDAAAPKGGVYIGSKENITIGQVAAGKDVGIETDGYIHQTDNGKRPAIIAGENLHLVSNHDNVGDPNNYLTVKVGDKLDAHAPEGGVYIYGYGDLTVDKVEAGKDVAIGGNEDIIIPHDKPEGNIIAGGDVKIEAGDSVLNGGGEEVGIVSGGDIEIIANLNQKDPSGTIGELPYNDLSHSINVILKGEVKADEVGVPTADKVLNVHIMGQDAVTPSSDGTDPFTMDDRDQRNMKFLAEDDNNDASVRNNRQHLRYNVANSEYILLDSNSASGAKVKDVLNISKQGMLVQTDELPQLGENIAITMDYKGLPFTVEGQVVRTDAAKKTAGIQFNNIDQFTSSMILYLGMMNGI